MNSAIQVCGLKKSYGSNIVLNGLDFEIKKGETFALLGVNGAGKTTALECIEGLKKYDSGAITINGKMGIQLQSSSLPAHIKPMEAIRLFSKWNRAKVDFTMLNALGIKDIEKKQYIQLSTGQKRRLHLALALIGNPDIIFLDEPTAFLDVASRVEVLALLRKLARKHNKAILLSSHDIASALGLSDRVWLLPGDGTLRDDTPSALIAAHDAGVAGNALDALFAGREVVFDSRRLDYVGKS